jgi:hypothetical protein
MKVAEILEVDGCRFIEPSFADQTEHSYTALSLGIGADEARLLVDEDEEPLALALHDESGWHAVSFLFRKPMLVAIERFEEVGGEIYQEDRMKWCEAVREYFSHDICKNVVPALEDLPPDRREMIRDLIREVWGARPGYRCLDCCCGSGVGTAALRDNCIRAVAYDNDASLLSLGLHRGRLVPGDTMCIDAREASRFVEPVPLGAAFMAGEIYSYNAALWEPIVGELLSLTDETLITVGTPAEAALVEDWCALRGRSTEVFENTRDPFYDRWCCIAGRER